MQFFQSSDQPSRAYKMHAVAVYDSTGRVVHMHHAILFAERTPDAAALSADAMEHAKSAGHAGTLETMVLKDPPKPGSYRIDLVKREFVVEPAPARMPRKV